MIGGCGVLFLLILCAFALNTLYWMNRVGVFAQGPTEMTPILPESLPPGDVAGGEALFRGDAACYACHSLEPGVDGAGPSLAGLAARAATTKPDTAAEAYILESIVNPDAHIVTGFSHGVMPPNFGHRLSQQQLADLTAFLMTQE